MSWAVRTAIHELQRRVRRLGGGKNFPHKIQLEVSSFCNMDCTYCALRDRMPENTLLDRQVFDKLRPSFKYMRTVQLSGLAEPLVNKNFAYYVREIKAESKGCQTVAFSNLTLLREEMAEQLIIAGLDSLVFSLDGIDHELVNIIRPGARNENVLENVRMLQQLKRKLGSRTPVLGATIVMQRKNYHQLPLVIEAISDLGITSLGINGMDPYYPDLIGEVLWDPKNHPHDLRQVLDRTFRFAAEHGINVIIPSFRPRPPVCTVIHMPIVMANGDVVPCTQTAYPRDTQLTVSKELTVAFNPGRQATKTFGNVLESGLNEIWQSTEYLRFRQSIGAGNFPDICGRCNIKHNCVCPQHSVAQDELLSEL